MSAKIFHCKTNHSLVVAEAVAEARDWLAVDDFEDERMTADLEAALRAFDRAVDAGDLAGALAECVSISQDWASNDTSGFRLLKKLVEG
jgi:hypothetical protein